MDTTYSNDKLADVLRKVRGLIAKADSTDFPAEADALRTQAEALMFKYRLDESQLTAEEKAAQHFSVQWRTIVLCDAHNRLSYFYSTMLAYTCQHLDIMYRLGYEINHETGLQDRVAYVVGYGSDLAFVDMLFTSAALAFRQRLEPTVDRNLSDQVNAYNLRMSGMTGRDIALAIYGSDTKALRPKVRKMFEAEAVKRGEDPKPLLGKGVDVKHYRESYATGFTRTWATRLATMRSERNDQGGLVLAGRADAIREAFYDRYPEARPKAAVPGEAGVRHHECPKCAQAKSGYCREHGWLRPKASRVRYANPHGYSAGADAARRVDVGGTKGIGS